MRRPARKRWPDSPTPWVEIARIDTYIEADEPRTISPFEGMSLVDLIVKTGIAEAIAARLGDLSGNRDAIAETIENNVRRRILKEHLSDPAFYAKMKRIASLVERVEAGQAEDTPEALNRSPALRALYHNLKARGRKPGRPELVDQAPALYDGLADPVLDLAQRLDAAVKRVRPDGWRGVRAREMVNGSSRS